MTRLAEGAGARTRALVIVLAVVVGLTLGIGATVALTRDGQDAAGPLEPTDPSAVTTTPVAVPAPPGAVAATPQAAVEGFLDAEIAGDLATSFTFLSAQARSGFGSPAGWTARHADLVAPVRAYEVEEVDQDEVTTLVTFEPGLDEVMGLVAERTRVTWATSDEGGSWGIELAASTLEPLHPAPEAAPAAVAAWAEAHQACRPARTWDGNLRGSPALAERLCGAPGDVAVGPALPLAAVDAAPFLAAFGPEAGTWARVVAVTRPVPLRAVVAPIGQEWLVIGVLP